MVKIVLQNTHSINLPSYNYYHRNINCMSMERLILSLRPSVCPTATEILTLLMSFDRKREKKEEIWLSPMTKAPSPAEMSKGQSENTNNVIKNSNTQRLRADLGRSVGVTTATQLVWLTGFFFVFWCTNNRALIFGMHFVTIPFHWLQALT